MRCGLEDEDVGDSDGSEGAGVTDSPLYPALKAEVRSALRMYVGTAISRSRYAEICNEKSTYHKNSRKQQKEMMCSSQLLCSPVSLPSPLCKRIMPPISEQTVPSPALPQLQRPTNRTPQRPPTLHRTTHKALFTPRKQRASRKRHSYTMTPGPENNDAAAAVRP